MQFARNVKAFAFEISDAKSANIVPSAAANLDAPVQSAVGAPAEFLLPFNQKCEARKRRFQNPPHLNHEIVCQTMHTKRLDEDTPGPPAFGRSQGS